uniref:Uncharacterized protein n=1 Tax=Arundo donax TaxID=35708 RepID=A0A0A9HF83_ARUDO
MGQKSVQFILIQINSPGN